MAEKKRTTPGPVQYGSEDAVRAAVPGGRDEESRTGQGEVRPRKGGRGEAGTDRFVSSEVPERAAERGTPTRKTTS